MTAFEIYNIITNKTSNQDMPLMKSMMKYSSTKTKSSAIEKKLSDSVSKKNNSNANFLK